MHPYRRTIPVHLIFLSLVSVHQSEFLKLWDEEREFLAKRSIKYWGANLLTYLNAIVLIF